MIGKKFETKCPKVCEVLRLKNSWVLCPICKNKTRIRVRVDTILHNFPLFCPKCKQESLIHVKNTKVSVIQAEPKMID